MDFPDSPAPFDVPVSSYETSGSALLWWPLTQQQDLYLLRSCLLVLPYQFVDLVILFSFFTRRSGQSICSPSLREAHAEYHGEKRCLVSRLQYDKVEASRTHYGVGKRRREILFKEAEVYHVAFAIVR